MDSLVWGIIFLIVDWWKVVWFNKAIPRFAFITWLAMRDWHNGELVVSFLCVICRAFVENMDHLFFKCSFSQRIWRRIMSACCQDSMLDEWDAIVSWATQYWNGKSLKSHMGYE